MSDIEFEQGVNETTEAIVQASTRITPESTDEVRQIALRIEEPAFNFLEGQNIGVLVPGPHPFGNKSHHRYYTIANAKGDDSGVELELLVRRCFYIDEVSGEEYPGIASHYLCNAHEGDKISLTGPYRSPFRIPTDKNSNLLMLGTGTGIAPFRAFLRRVYDERNDWGGKVRLYFGARTGTDLLYMNDLNNDLANYYDQKTFQAIQTLSKGVLSDAADALRDGVEAHAEEVWDLVCSPNTHVYLAGMKKAADEFEASMARLAGSGAQWQTIKQGLVDDRRWSELTYI
ncbi:MAG: FAD-binding oxidoreductase [Pseudomonadota bacterium]|nr:FAD-binding oxidoreductase [Pseudomonadota bacterium]